MKTIYSTHDIAVKFSEKAVLMKDPQFLQNKRIQ